MHTLYYAPGACSLSVHIALEWIGHPYQAVKSKLGDPDYLKINPAGAVPALDIGTDEPLTQCGAILRYLSRRYPAADLADDANLERSAELERWSAFFTGDLHPAFFPVFMPQRYTTSTDREELDRVRTAGLELVRKKLALLDRRLEGRAFLLDDKRTFVDAYSVPMVRWGYSVLGDRMGEFPDVMRHHAHMLADDGVKRAMMAEGLPVPA